MSSNEKVSRYRRLYEHEEDTLARSYGRFISEHPDIWESIKLSEVEKNMPEGIFVEVSSGVPESEIPQVIAQTLEKALDAAGVLQTDEDLKKKFVGNNMSVKGYLLDQAYRLNQDTVAQDALDAAVAGFTQDAHLLEMNLDGLIKLFPETKREMLKTCQQVAKWEYFYRQILWYKKLGATDKSTVKEMVMAVCPTKEKFCGIMQPLLDSELAYGRFVTLPQTQEQTLIPMFRSYLAQQSAWASGLYGVPCDLTLPQEVWSCAIRKRG